MDITFLDSYYKKKKKKKKIQKKKKKKKKKRINLQKGCLSLAKNILFII